VALLEATPDNQEAKAVSIKVMSFNVLYSTSVELTVETRNCLLFNERISIFVLKGESFTLRRGVPDEYFG